MSKLSSLLKTAASSNIVWTIGSGYDYPNLGAAFAAYEGLPTLPGVTVTFQIAATHTITAADQLFFQNMDAGNLIIETLGGADIPVNASGFSVDPLTSFAQLFTIWNSKVGNIIGRFAVTVPHGSAPTAGISLLNGSFEQVELPPGPTTLSFTDFSRSIVAFYGSGITLGGTFTNSGLLVNLGQTVTIANTSLVTNSSPVPLAVVEAQNGNATVLLEGGTLTNTAAVPAFNAEDGAHIKSSADVITGQLLHLSHASADLSGSLTVDQALLLSMATSLIHLEAASNAQIRVNGFSLLNTTATTFLTLDAESTITFDNNLSYINSADWSSVCNLPIGQRFPRGGGVFGLRVDNDFSCMGFYSETMSEAGSAVRRTYSSYVNLSGMGPFLNYSFFMDDASMPLGTSVLLLVGAAVNTLNIVSNQGAPTVTVTASAGDYFRVTIPASGQMTVTREYPLPKVASQTVQSRSATAGVYTLTTADAGLTLVFNDVNPVQIDVSNAFAGQFHGGFEFNFRNVQPGAMSIYYASALIQGAGAPGTTKTVSNPNKVNSVYLETGYDTGALAANGIVWVAVGDYV